MHTAAEQKKNKKGVCIMSITDKIEIALDNLNKANEEFTKNPTALNKRAVEEATKWWLFLLNKAEETP